MLSSNFRVKLYFSLVMYGDCTAVVMYSMETCNSVTFYLILFHEKSHFLILAGSAVTAPIIFGQMHFLLISENEIFHEIKLNKT